MRIFKVETVGDCYVAVAGLPTARIDHAIVMAKFAAAIRSKMDVLARELETTLGPDTVNLGLRIGLNSAVSPLLAMKRDKFTSERLCTPFYSHVYPLSAPLGAHLLMFFF